MFGIAIDQDAQLIRIPKGRERSIDQTDDFTQANLCWARRASRYPPLAPRTLSTMRAFFSSRRISSRNFSGRFSS